MRYRCRLLSILSTTLAALIACPFCTASLWADETDELPPPVERQIDFRADVEPIFAKHCQSCHGAEKRESNFRLDLEGPAKAGGDFGEAAIVPGDGAGSPVVRYAAGLDLEMPPEGPPLSAEQVGILRAWIDQGATWPQSPEGHDDSETLTTDHWSFQELSRPNTPEVNDAWISGPIDAFILAKLNEAGMAPSPEADRVTLIRRLYLDMHGLPPTPEQVAAFVNDASGDAYEKLVDRVLASPRYGERWARHWLDVVRFAETNGFETNTPRPNAWHYRDYVIRSLNEDKPYDQFVLEQLAGDALGVDAATGFLVGGPYDTVKSPDINLTLTQRQDELADMVNTTGTALLGVTMGCARCHNHKFDPVLQKDYYALQAALAGVRHGERQLRGADNTAREEQAKEVRRELELLDLQLAELEGQLDAAEPLAQPSVAASNTDDSALSATRPPVNPRRNVDRFHPVVAQRLRFAVLATNGNSEPCVDELEIYTTGNPPRNVALGQDVSVTSSGDYSGNPKHQLAHINDGQYGNSQSWIANTAGEGWIEVELPEAIEIDHVVWGRDRESNFVDRLAVQYTIEISHSGEAWQVVADHTDRASESEAAPSDEGEELPSEHAELDRHVKKLRQQRESLNKRLNELSKPQMVYAGSFEQPGTTHRLYRGDPMQAREPVPPDTLSVLGSLGLPLDAPEQERRLTLGRWIVNDGRGLSARVMANRVWHYHFGRGIVATPSDFGAAGARPTHPELLDWLASELVEGGWKLKPLHREILLSNTYRQANRPHQQGLDVDADALLLWRFPPRRLEAEAIRDSVLAVAGTLNLEAGGPGYSVFEPNENYVRVYQPRERFESPQWRRMVYMTKVRMERDAVFGAFDSPDAAQVCPRRTQSTTPLQALNLLNSTFITDQAEHFAERLREEAGGEPADQVRGAFLLTTGRAPDPEETTAAVQLVEEHSLEAFCRVAFNLNEFLFLP